MGVAAARHTSVDGILNFGGLSGTAFTGSTPAFSVLPVPYDLTASYISGMRNGPRAIIEASTHMELYDEELDCEPYEAGIETCAQMEATALGPEEMIKRVRAAVSGIIAGGRIPVLLGGEHSITLGLVQALLDKYPLLSVLQLDAHADMRDTYQDTPFNHACVARRISELCPIVQVGIRSLCIEEAEFLKRGEKAGKNARIKTHYATDVLKGINWKDVVKDLTADVCITIDLDVFDPAIMPATGTPEPGGLLWHDVLSAVKATAGSRRVVGFDVVELCPLPGVVAPDFLAAKLVYKMMAYVNASKNPGRSKPGRKRRQTAAFQ
ncbi:MAG: agmatinase [Deltaproteobacteria bacterium]|nr:agmatinase [Deltaproteobacteria bacterium]